MLVHRLAGPSRLPKVHYVQVTHYPLRKLGRRGMSRSSPPSTALVTTPSEEETTWRNTLSEARKAGRNMEKVGFRGQERKPLDDIELPTLDVYMPNPVAPGEQELYFPYYPRNIAQWPWAKLPRQVLMGLLHWLTSPFRFIKNNGSRLFLPRYWSLNAVKRLLQKPIVVPARYIVDAANKGPAARTTYLQRVENDRANFLAMSQLANYQLFPDYTFEYSKLADRGWFTFNLWKQRKQRKDENRLFSDLSSKKSPLYPTLRSAADAYVKMTAAVARGDTTTLPQYAGKKYLATVAKRARQVADNKHKTNYQWQFEKWIQDPQCISIRSDDILSRFNRSLVPGERLYINMLVKFESLQSMVVSERFSRGKLQTETSIVTRKVTRPVVEYLVLDVRTWVPGRSPKFVQEVFEGQEFVIKRDDAMLRDTATKGDAADGNKAANPDSSEARTSPSPAL
ncbi:hypothetical protein CPB86DRAFT_781693 [Serendipita vermifera]|nr:hypothetical protein CPB86DRAFT_781693 [Serendipita vermifera]